MEGPSSVAGTDWRTLGSISYSVVQFLMQRSGLLFLLLLSPLLIFREIPLLDCRLFSLSIFCNQYNMTST